MRRALRKPNREIEIKLRIRNLPALLRKLRELRAKPSTTVFERNALYDTPNRDFSQRSAILRIRTEAPTAAPGSPRRISKRGNHSIEGLLTYKGLLPGAASRNPRYKIREEIEYRLPNAPRFERLLFRLGLKPWFRYEKFRTQYRLRSFPGLHLDLDETPIGVYLELDGSKYAIDRAARLLGFSPADYITVSYLDLHLAACRRRGCKPGHMAFSSKQSLR
ncbi:MAG TPA: class IV adenylate cyclase [Candidatus Acidoferrales bacterium]|nr:class IV adenylate cyclase [Candidatus Acidoferrales bacterium]